MRIRVAESPAGCGDAVSVLDDREPRPCMACRLREANARAEKAEAQRDDLQRRIESTLWDVESRLNPPPPRTGSRRPLGFDDGARTVCKEVRRALAGEKGGA